MVPLGTDRDSFCTSTNSQLCYPTFQKWDLKSSHHIVGLPKWHLLSGPSGAALHYDRAVSRRAAPSQSEASPGKRSLAVSTGNRAGTSAVFPVHTHTGPPGSLTPSISAFSDTNTSIPAALASNHPAGLATVLGL